MQSIGRSGLLLFDLVSLQNNNSFVNLGSERLARLEHVQQLGIVNFEQHARDLAGPVGMHAVNERIESLAEHLLLLLGLSGGQHAAGEGLLAGHIDGLGRIGRLGRGARHLLRPVFGHLGSSLGHLVGLGLALGGRRLRAVHHRHSNVAHLVVVHAHTISVGWPDHAGVGRVEWKPGARLARINHLVVLVSVAGHLGAGLSAPARRRSHLGRESGRRVEARRRVLHGRQVDAGGAAWREHLAQLLVLQAGGCYSLHVLRGQMVLAVFFSLGQGNVQWFGTDYTAVHVCHCFGSFFWCAEAHKAEALRPTKMNRKIIILKI
ncbi:hypothetical protein BpHYR1_032681 [Brachionus plicatilis]|uniref:Uncharacterized protein n=1 Tax=Brachionus plicatilis TaxID=10195 RepID=A0A3M7QPQ6_BRAPC|nr:hypothetical protein BpHYR1_032681 [Brachionus plicatilis]